MPEFANCYERAGYGSIKKHYLLQMAPVSRIDFELFSFVEMHVTVQI